MKIIKCDAWGRPREIQLSDNETILKHKHDELVRGGEERENAYRWLRLGGDPSLTETQQRIIRRYSFRVFLTHNHVNRS